MKEHDCIRLYHGNYCEVREPDLDLCRRGKDFGKGFYLTTSREQAERFTKTSMLKARRDGRIGDESKAGFISVFSFYPDNSRQSIFEFADADRDWLHCVASYRKQGSISSLRWNAYDVIIGKIANDKTNLVITAYLDGAYGEVGTESADTIAISLLEPDKLKDQYCFRTEAALDALKFVTSERVEL